MTEFKRKNFNFLIATSIFLVLYLVILTLNQPLEFYHAIIFYIAYRAVKYLKTLFIKYEGREVNEEI